MSIHLGEIVQKEVELKRLTYREFGSLIHRNEKTIPDIFARASMSTDLLLNICEALKTDLLAEFYKEEPLQSLRNDEVYKLNIRIQSDIELIEKMNLANLQIEKELSLALDLNNALKHIVSLLNGKCEKQIKRTVKMKDKNIRIAIADDHKLIREALKTICILHGLEVVIEASNGQSLIDKVEFSAILPHVCIVDGSMPIMDGAEAIEKIKSRWDSIKIIGYSSDNINKDIMLEKGADVFLPKSCDSNQLVASIREVCANSVIK